MQAHSTTKNKLAQKRLPPKSFQHGSCKTELVTPMFISELWIKFLRSFDFVKIKQDSFASILLYLKVYLPWNIFNCVLMIAKQLISLLSQLASPAVLLHSVSFFFFLLFEIILTSLFSPEATYVSFLKKKILLGKPMTKQRSCILSPERSCGFSYEKKNILVQISNKLENLVIQRTAHWNALGLLTIHDIFLS